MADAFDAAIDARFRDPNFGRDVVYTPTVGSAATVRAIPIDPSDAVDLLGIDARKPGQGWEIRRSQLPTKPTRGATIVTDGKTYVVQAVAEREGGRVFRCDCNRTS